MRASLAERPAILWGKDSFPGGVAPKCNRFNNIPGFRNDPQRSRICREDLSPILANNFAGLVGIDARLEEFAHSTQQRDLLAINLKFVIRLCKIGGTIRD